MALTANSFAKCAPSISTNIAECGSVALCNAQPLTTDDIDGVYMKSSEYRVIGPELMAEAEMKMCGATQNGLYDFLMANKVNLQHKLIPHGRDTGLLQIAPFVKLRQYDPINNQWWFFTGGEASGETNWAISVSSAGNVPLDVRSFQTGINLYLKVATEGGGVQHVRGRVVSATLNGDVIDVVLEGLRPTDAEPVSGYLSRGGNNVSDYEENCDENPAYLTKRLVPFWVKTSRWPMCKSSAYDQYRQLLLENNALFREFGNLDETQRNKQLADQFQRQFVEDFFWGQPISDNQTLADFDELEDITAFDSSVIDDPDGGVCVGKRAEPVGIYHQLAECDRVVDLLGEGLNLPALFRALYDIIRVRATRGDSNRNVDLFTDSVTAEWINRAMIMYYASKSADHNGDTTLRLNMDITNQKSKTASFGFLYKEYELFWPAGVTLRVLTHYAFDDELDVATSAGSAAIARRAWILDFSSGIYPGIIASNRVVNNTGDLKARAAVDSGYLCVMKVHTRMVTMNSLTFTNVLECPGGNLILENFALGDPADSITDDGRTYPETTTTTTPA